jgi:hypothetical protein
MANKVLYDISYVRFKQDCRQDKEYHIEQFGNFIGLLSAFVHLFIYSTPKEDIWDSDKYSSYYEDSNLFKLREKLYDL